jgi:hypothetical protein
MTLVEVQGGSLEFQLVAARAVNGMTQRGEFVWCGWGDLNSHALASAGT